MAQNGRLMRIAISDGIGGFDAIAGAQEDSFTLENGEIDITNKDSAARRTLLAGGTQQVNLSTSGVMITDDAANTGDLLFTAARTGDLTQFEITWEDGEKITAFFQVRSYERSGAHDGPTEFSCEFASSGAYTFVAGT